MFYFPPYIGTIRRCIRANFACVGREFSALEAVNFYNVESNGNLVFILRVLAIGAIFEELIKLVGLGSIVGSTFSSYITENIIYVYYRTTVGYLCVRKGLAHYEKRKIHIVA